MRRAVFTFLVVVASLATSVSQAATDWSTQDYDLYPGDFDGDSRTDLLYIAKDPSKPSGIAKSNGSGPNISLQTWPSNYLGIPWHSNTYSAVVADFNGDGRADVLLQRSTAGDHYVLLTNTQGELTGVHQTIPNSHLGLTWSADQHRIISGDFNGDGKADLFLQSTNPTDLNAVVLANAAGQFTSGPQQSWTDTGAPGGYKWSTKNALVYAGDFNADGRADLLLQAKPNIVLIDYEIPIPVPTYPPNMNGVLLAQSGATIFSSLYGKSWSRNSFGADWSPNTANLIVGDFNGDNRADVLLQGRRSGSASLVVSADGSGNIFGASAATISSNIDISGEASRLLVGRFNGSSRGIYVQATDPAGSNYIAHNVGSTVSASGHNPGSVTGTAPPSAIGATPGSHSVTATGQANYSIPLSLPPGVNGMTPRTSLEYQSNRGNGLLGMNWNVSGFSTITRCNKTYAQDGAVAPVTLTTSDEFCIDGNRLRLVSGQQGYPDSVYRAEMETFDRITAKNWASNTGSGPAWFRVEGSDGLYYEYGNSTDSKLVTQYGYVLVWALSSIRDRVGNVISFHYTQDATNGNYRPAEIRYAYPALNATGAPKAKVAFVYESRSDLIPGYYQGNRLNEVNRLDRVDIYLDGAVVRKYELGYQQGSSTGRSRLTSVQECAGGTCLPATTIHWAADMTGFGDEVSVGIQPGDLKYSIPCDFNGDGREDLAYFSTASDSWHVLFGSASGFSADVDTSYGAGAYYQQAISGDLDGDGRRDILVPDLNGATVQWFLLRHSSTHTWSYATTSVTADGRNGDAWLMDATGDGLDDLLWKHSNSEVRWRKRGSPTSFDAAQTAFMNYNGFTTGPYGANSNALRPFIQVGDFNGDGARDALMLTQYGELLNALGGTSGFEVLCCTPYGSQPTQPYIANFNGDRYSDIFYYETNVVFTPPQVGSWMIWPTSGYTDVGAYPANRIGNYQETFVTDWDGDGYSDLISRNTSSQQWEVFRSTGDYSLSAAIPTQTPATGANAAPKFIDINGDGLQDLVYSDSGALKVRLHAGPKPDRLMNIVDGLGNSVAFNLEPLANASCYSRDTSPLGYPRRESASFMHVTCSVSSSDGIGGAFTVSHKYLNAAADAQGRGFSGFQRRDTTDERTGVTRKESFRQDFPFIGMVSYAETLQSSGLPRVPISEETYTLISHPSIGGGRVFPYASAVVAKAYAVGGASNGALMTTATSTSTVDAWGTVTDQTTTLTEENTGSNPGSTFSRRIYHPAVTNDDANWCFRKPTQTQFINSHSLPSGAQITRETSHGWNTTLCRRLDDVVEPNHATLRLVTSYGYDGFGNLNSLTVAPINAPTRVTSITFTSDGRFPYIVDDASNDPVRTLGFDSLLGVLASEIDGNGLTTYFDYDRYGRLTKERRPDGTETQIDLAWCAAGCGLSPAAKLQATVSSKNTASQSVFEQHTEVMDAFGRQRAIRSYRLGATLQSELLTEYNNRGAPSRTSSPHFIASNFEWTSYTYDLIGRLTDAYRPRTSDQKSTAWSESIRFNGLAVTHTDTLGHSTVRKLNAIGQTIQVVDAAQYDTDYQYDAFGNLKKTIDFLGNEISLGYNVRGLKDSSIDPDMGSSTFEYFATGELKKQTDAKGQVTEFTYDPLGRPSTRTELEQKTTWLWGQTAASKNVGRLQNVKVEGLPSLALTYSETHGYDAAARRSTVSTNAGGSTYVMSYGYSAVHGALNTITYPAITGSQPFKVQYDYASDVDANDRSGMLRRVKDYDAPSTIFWAATEANAFGQVSRFSLQNGLATTRSFDSITGAINAIATGPGGNNATQQLSYTWEGGGNLEQRRDINQNIWEDFTYDVLDRLDTVKRNGTLTLDIDYNQIGNITKKSDVSASNWTYHATKKHAVTAAGTNTYAYDANGNMMTRNGATTTWFSYNLPNRIDQAGGNYSQFLYGADRSRYRQINLNATVTETTTYIAQGLFEKVERPSGTEYKHHVVANDAIVAIVNRKSSGTTETYYPLHDHLGSVDKLTNGSGTTLASLSYDAFGRRRGAAWTGNPTTGEQTTIGNTSHRGYTEHEQLDNLSLIHMNGRVFDPVIGRFTSADPFVQAPFNSQSLNRYSYVFNNPLRYTDPSGFQAAGQDGEENWGWFYDGAPIVPYNERWTTIRGRGTAGVSPIRGADQDQESGVSTGWLPSGGRVSTVGGTSTGQMLTEAFVPGTGYYNLGYAAEAEGRYLAAFGWHTAGHLEVLGTLATAGVGGVLVGTTRGATAAVRGSAAAYSVAFETTIAKVGAGTRPAHFAAANKNLAAAMNADAGFAKMMDDLAIKIPSEFGRSPAGWTWHHVPDQPGVMQLVPRAQHQGSPWQSILHPGGKGGFSLWGVDF